MELKPGSRWKSAVCAAEVVVVRPPKTPVSLACGGIEMAAAAQASAETVPGKSDLMGGTHLGKRYVEPQSEIELLCVKGGEGSLSIDGRPAELKEAKRLPASD